MSKQGHIRRYTLIIEKIRTKQYPSFDIIKDYLFDHGFEVSVRTIQRDIEQIRYEFGIEIVYDRNRNGYFIDYDNSVNVESFFRFLEIVNTAELLTESLHDSKDALKYISFENLGSLVGIENLKPLLQAIKDKRTVSFTHHSFEKDVPNDYTISPYLLREYQNRWYLIGLFEDSGKSRTFGIDRITNLKVSTKTFKPDPKFNANELFDHVIGMVYSINKKEEVTLSFTPKQGKYIKTLPLHRSQEIIIDNDKELRITLDIIPNYEFTQKILMHGDTITVIKPKWLADEIKETAERIAGKY